MAGERERERTDMPDIRAGLQTVFNNSDTLNFLREISHSCTL